MTACSNRCTLVLGGLLESLMSVGLGSGIGKGTYHLLVVAREPLPQPVQRVGRERDPELLEVQRVPRDRDALPPQIGAHVVRGPLGDRRDAAALRVSSA